MDSEDFQNLKLARPVAVVDLWDVEDRITRLEAIVERFEHVLEGFLVLYKEERIKTWEMILRKILEEEKGRPGGTRTG